MPVLLKAFGAWLVLDGALSLVLCSDKGWNCQAVRIIRILIGIALFFIK